MGDALLTLAEIAGKAGLPYQTVYKRFMRGEQGSNLVKQQHPGRRAYV